MWNRINGGGRWYTGCLNQTPTTAEVTYDINWLCDSFVTNKMNDPYLSFPSSSLFELCLMRRKFHSPPNNKFVQKSFLRWPESSK